MQISKKLQSVIKYGLKFFTLKERNIECIIVCDNTHSIQKDGAVTVVVDKGSDSADCKIANIFLENELDGKAYVILVDSPDYPCLKIEL